MRLNRCVALAGLLVFALQSAAQAALFKCKSASGAISIQDTPCVVTGATEPQRPIPGQKNESFTKRQSGSQADANWNARSAENQAAMANMPKSQRIEQAEAQVARALADPKPQATWQQQEAAYQKRQGQARARSEAEAEAARNNRMSCQQAINNLSALRVQRPVLRTDKNGSQYVGDDERSEHVKRAERQVAESCN